MHSLFCFFLAFLVSGEFAFGQNDSVLIGKRFVLQSYGLSYRDGVNQFFEGYDYEILNANVKTGMPVFLDWPDYAGEIILPDYQQFAGHAAWVDTSRGFKLRAGLTWFQRHDSMRTSGAFIQNDTIFGRNASEKGQFYGLTLGGMKMTRKYGNFIRLYGGAEIEAMFSPKSDIYFLLYAYDFSEQAITEVNEFYLKGKPRFNIFASALLGLETVFSHRFGFFLEVKSGLGTQLVLRESAFGMAKNAYHLGINYYLWDYQRKKPPPPKPILKDPESF